MQKTVLGSSLAMGSRGILKGAYSPHEPRPGFDFPPRAISSKMWVACHVAAAADKAKPNDAFHADRW